LYNLPKYVGRKKIWKVQFRTDDVYGTATFSTIEVEEFYGGCFTLPPSLCRPSLYSPTHREIIRLLITNIKSSI